MALAFRAAANACLLIAGFVAGIVFVIEFGNFPVTELQKVNPVFLLEMYYYYISIAVLLGISALLHEAANRNIFYPF